MLTGRNLEIQKCISMLTNEKYERLVLLQGLDGMGKMAIAKYAVKYCLDRNYYKDGAFQIEGRGRQNCKSFMSKTI